MQSLQPLGWRVGLKQFQVCRRSSQPEDDGGAHGLGVTKLGSCGDGRIRPSHLFRKALFHEIHQILFHLVVFGAIAEISDNKTAKTFMLVSGRKNWRSIIAFSPLTARKPGSSGRRLLKTC